MHCGFLLFDGFSNLVLASAIEPLRVARDYSLNAAGLRRVAEQARQKSQDEVGDGDDAAPEKFAWKLLSIDGGDVVSSSGISLRCQASLAQSGPLDILFVVAGYGARAHALPAVIRGLQLAERRMPVLGALDCGAWLLAAAGLLNGHKATIHWQDLSQFAEQYLDIEVSSERFILDGTRISAGGATTVLDLMQRLIGQAGGGALAFEVTNMFIHDGRQRTPANRGARNLQLSKRAPQLIKAVNLMRENIEQPLSLEQIAAEAAMSPRSLLRLFQREFGLAPGRYYESMRLEFARSLVEETVLSADEIAARTGYASSSCLSRAFRSNFGHTLRAARQRR